jgi:sugar phosphate isomerase/epimerase
LRRHFSAGELCVENLNFPLSEDLPLIRQFELSVCLDIGHLIRDGVDVAAAVAEFAPYLGYVHLHGVADRDHRAVAVLGQDRVREIGRLLLAANYRGPVCLEVFNEKDLNESLACVRRAWAGLCWAGL